MEKELSVLERPIYMNRIMPFVGKQLIKVITGQRRIGKSYLLKKIAEVIKGSDISANIININLEDFAFAHIVDSQTLHDAIAQRLKPDGMNYIFIDEIQEVRGFEKVVRSLNRDSNNDLYVTGSNSTMLSSEIAISLAGRSVEFRVHPLCYIEFLRFHNLKDSDETLELYLRYGGMPYLRNLTQQETWNEYLTGITDSIVYRDIVTRHSLRNNDFLKRLLLFMADNTGQLLTAKKISDYLKSQKLNVSVSGVQTYLEYIEDAFIATRCRRWNIEGKRFFEIGEKFFYEDLGIRNAIVGYRPQDISGIMKNVVYNHLRAYNYDVKIGMAENGREIDFIAEKNNEYKYIQVATFLNEPKTIEREFGNLLKIADNYEKIVVTLRDSATNTYNGIKVKNLRQFLTSEP